MSGYMNPDGSELVGGLLPNGQGQAFQLDAQGNLKTNSTSQAGTIAPAAAQPNITTAGADTAYTLSAQAHRFLVQNLSSINVSVELDAATGPGSVVLVPGASWSDPIEVTTFHFLAASAISINNGTTGIIAKGWQ